MTALRAVIAVPARDEEALIGACIRALAAQRGIAREAYEVILVLDGCTDGALLASRHPGRRVRPRRHDPLR